MDDSSNSPQSTFSNLPLIGGAASVIGGIAGNIASSGQYNSAIQTAQQAYNQYLAAGLPPDQASKAALQMYQSAGKLNPAMQQNINQGPSSVANMQVNQQGRNAQMAALQLMQQRQQGGMTATDRAAYNQMRDQAGADTQGKIQQIQQNFQARGGGVGGGMAGAELAANLQGAQSGANRESQAANQLGAQAEQAALQAGAQSGQLGGQVSQQDFNVSNTKAQAQDQLNRFNTQNQLAVQAANVQAQNQAQGYNLQNQQNINNANTQQNNAETYRQLQAQQQYWQNMMGRAGSLQQAGLGLANVQMGQANRTAGGYQGVGTGISQGVGAYTNYNGQTAQPQTQSNPYSGNVASSGQTQIGPWSGGYGAGNNNQGYTGGSYGASGSDVIQGY